MTKEENLKILNCNFEELWNNLWKETAKDKIYQKEFQMSKLKFNELKQYNFYGLLEKSELSEYLEPEWGFPKGRRNSNEKNLNCATREFTEETTIGFQHLHVLERLNCVAEDYIGTNLTNYRHIYYLASSDVEININIDDNYEFNEISDIKWFTIPEAINKIRPYYKERVKMIHQIYFFIINLIIQIKANKSTDLNI